MPSLHGIPTNADLNSTARHEAGHLLMLWLLDCQGVACGIADGCGLTQQLKSDDAPLETQHEHILYALAGMVAENNTFLLDELRANVEHPERFDVQSDSFHVSLAISRLSGNPEVWLDGYAEGIRRLQQRFAKALTEATRLVRERGIISFDITHALFQKWDDVYFADGRVKSDLVGRTIARVMGWHVPREIQLGWDLKPLPPDWKPMPRFTLKELAMKIKAGLDRKDV